MDFCFLLPAERSSCLEKTNARSGLKWATVASPLSMLVPMVVWDLGLGPDHIVTRIKSYAGWNYAKHLKHASPVVQPGPH